jgi:His/Glu/Gln/Arg/opine family amino acid ABC transporter permease subunit
VDYVFHFGVFWQYSDQFFQACLLTFELAAICIAYTTVAGIVNGVLLLAGNGFVRRVVKIYVDMFRLTPFLVQLLFVYFGLPLMLGIKISPTQAGVVTLSLNGAAYAGETFRAGFQSVPKTQLQAGLSLGFTTAQTYLRIVIPQGLRIVLPSYMNSVVEIFKDTSFFSIIGVTEATGMIRYAASMTYRNFELFTLLGLFYFICTTIIGQLGHLLEKYLQRHELS